MRIAATAATLLFALTACSTIEENVSPYQQPNGLMSNEINQRIDQIPYQHREELVQNLLWLSQTGEQTIPALLTGLASESPKVRSSCCWVLGRLRDRRTVPQLQKLCEDSETSVRMEACRTLVLMGDLQQSPRLIEGLDSDRKEVRYMCHEALKTATGHDFGYDHLNQNQQELRVAVLHWRQWWGEYAGDTFFASNYEQEHGLNNLAAPGGETKMPDPSSENAQPASDTTGDSKSEPPSSAASTGEVMPPETTTEVGTGQPEVAVPPSVPPGKVETIEVIEVGAEQAKTGAESSTETPTEPPVKVGAESTKTEVVKPIPVIEVPPATGGSASSGNGTGSKNGGN